MPGSTVLPTVTIPQVDYAANQAASIATLMSQLSTMQAQLRATQDPNTQDLLTAQIPLVQAQIAFLQAAVTPTIPYVNNAPLICKYKACPNPQFTASFPGNQRSLACPSCGNVVDLVSLVPSIATNPLGV